jgi:hypothetical protein
VAIGVEIFVAIRPKALVIGRVSRDLVPSTMVVHISEEIARTEFFSAYWCKARGEFNEKFANYVDQQIEIITADD